MELQQLKDSIDLITDIDLELQRVKTKLEKQEYLESFKKFLTKLSEELFKIMESDLCLTDEEKYISEIKRITAQVKLIDKFTKFDIHKFCIYYSDQYD